MPNPSLLKRQRLTALWYIETLQGITITVFQQCKPLENFEKQISFVLARSVLMMFDGCQGHDS